MRLFYKGHKQCKMEVSLIFDLLCNNYVLIGVRLTIRTNPMTSNEFVTSGRT